MKYTTKTLYDLKQGLKSSLVPGQHSRRALSAHSACSVWPVSDAALRHLSHPMPLAPVTSLPQARQPSPGLPIKCGVRDMCAGFANNAHSTGYSGRDRAGCLLVNWWHYSLHSGPGETHLASTGSIRESIRLEMRIQILPWITRGIQKCPNGLVLFREKRERGERTTKLCTNGTNM